MQKIENLITQKINSIQVNNEELEEEADGDEIQKGIIVDLGDFILNLLLVEGFNPVTL